MCWSMKLVFLSGIGIRITFIVVMIRMIDRLVGISWLAGIVIGCFVFMLGFFFSF